MELPAEPIGEVPDVAPSNHWRRGDRVREMEHLLSGAHAWYGVVKGLPKATHW